ncbi:hypothetical protein OUZ56_014295 [Daphnia magna]|uniref:Secreted protein n=1 Tax=Daphnia magna TaxID=35525 RepID=A0ABR0AJE3_9CRUS|nr:hypothetical protein OUZ56_014295 [Daphnia magna]
MQTLSLILIHSKSSALPAVRCCVVILTRLTAIFVDVSSAHDIGVLLFFSPFFRSTTHDLLLIATRGD